MLQEKQLKENSAQPKLQKSSKEFESVKQRVPIYKRIEDEIRKKEVKIKEIKEKQEIEKKLKNKERGILDEEEIIRMKQEKD